MIVNKLIKELEKYPWNAEVFVDEYDGYEDAYFLRRVVAVSPIGLGDALLQTEEQDE